MRLGFDLPERLGSAMVEDRHHDDDLRNEFLRKIPYFWHFVLLWSESGATQSSVSLDNELTERMNVGFPKKPRRADMNQYITTTTKLQLESSLFAAYLER